MHRLQPAETLQWSSTTGSHPVLRPRNEDFDAAQGNKTRVPCAERDALPTRTAQNQKVSFRAELVRERVVEKVGVVVGRGPGETSGGRHAEQKAERPEPAGQNSPWTLSIAMIGVDRAPCSSVRYSLSPAVWILNCGPSLDGPWLEQLES